MKKGKHSNFAQADPSNHQGENTWFTPWEFIRKLGPFDLDPCTVSFRPFETAEASINHDLGFCGIETEWHGDVWLNPPYGKQIMPFIDKFLTHRKGVMLIFARMGSEGVQKIIKSGAYIYCLRKRVAFIDREQKNDSNAGTDSLLIFFDDKYIQRVENGFQGSLMRKF